MLFFLINKSETILSKETCISCNDKKITPKCLLVGPGNITIPNQCYQMMGQRDKHNC